MIPKYKDPSNPGNQLDDETEPEARPSRRSSREGRRTSVPAEFKTRAEKNTKPPEVSERVWDMAEQWMVLGEEHFGKRPPVNKAEFSKRLDAKISEDARLQRWLRIRPERWQEVFPGKWGSGVEFVNDVMARMLELFYEHLTEAQKNTSALQFAFLSDEWDEWVYHAITSVQVQWHKAHGSWEAPRLPKAVFDPTTVGQPERDAQPSTEPMFEGMTWGEVRAQAAEDDQFLGERTDDEDTTFRELMDATQERFARLKSVMLANRENTTKETTSDEPT